MMINLKIKGSVPNQNDPLFKMGSMINDQRIHNPKIIESRIIDQRFKHQQINLNPKIIQSRIEDQGSKTIKSKIK